MENSNNTITERSTCILNHNIEFYSINHDFFQKYISKDSLSVLESSSFEIPNDQDILLSIQKLNYSQIFNIFNKFFIYFHTKGSTICEIIEFSSTNIFTSTHTSNFFNSFYSHIKKSKNIKEKSILNQSPEFNFIGNFTGVDFSTNNIKCFILFNKESLLDISSEENKISKVFSENIFPLVEYYILRKNLNKLKNNLQLVKSNIEGLSFSESNHLHKERIELIGNLSNILKHELSNPFFGIQLSLEILKDNPFIERELYTELKNSISKCHSIINNFSDYFNKNNSMVEINLVDAIKEALLLAKSKLRGIQVQIHTESDNPHILTNPGSLFHILFNLIINASESLILSKTPQPLITITVMNEGTKVRYIQIADNGPGISKAIQDEIFKAFYTTKEKGTGLGLFMSQSLAQSIHARITHLNVNGLCCFRVEFT